MAVLSFSQMPVSFTGQALFFAARTTWINPRTTKWDVDGIRKGLGSLFGAVFKISALFGFSVGTGILCAPLGVIYHGISALSQKTISCLSRPDARAHLDALAREHFKAMLTDISGISLVIFAGSYTLYSAKNPNSAMGWWFSSTPVDTEERGPLQFREQPGFPIRSAWEERSISTQRCPYDKMRAYAVRKWDSDGEMLPVNDRKVLDSIIANKFEDSQGKGFFDQNNLHSISRDYVSLGYVCIKNAGKPNYRLPDWKTALKITELIVSSGGYLICAIAQGSLALLLLSLLSKDPIGMILFSNIYTCISLASGGFAFENFQLLTKEINKLRSPTGYKEFLEKPLESTRLQDLAMERIRNGQTALFWLKTAAHHGNREAQRILGISLLAAVFKSDYTREEPKIGMVWERWRARVRDQGRIGDAYRGPIRHFMAQEQFPNIDHEDRQIILEGLAWLEAAARNGDKAADILMQRDLPRCRVDRLAIFFRKIHPMRRRLALAIAESQKQLHATEISQATGLVPGVCDPRLCGIIIDYLGLGLDERSLFFTPLE